MGHSVIRDFREVPQKASYWRDDYQHPGCDLISSPSVWGVYTLLYKGTRGQLPPGSQQTPRSTDN